MAGRRARSVSGFKREFLQGRQQFTETRQHQEDAPKYAYEIMSRLGLLEDVTKPFRDADLRSEGTKQWIDEFRDRRIIFF